MRRFTNVLACLFCAGISQFATADLRESMGKVAEQIRSRGVVDMSPINNATPAEILQAAPEFLNDRSRSVCSMAGVWIVLAYSRATEPADRKRGIELLVNVIAGEDRELAVYLAERLLPRLSVADMDEKQKDRLLPLITVANPPSEFILLAGAAPTADIIKRLSKLAEGADPIGHHGTAFTATLALARSGNEKMGQKIIRQFHELKPMDQIASMRQLAYIRTPQALSILEAFLLSDEKLPDEGDMGVAPFCMYALENMAQCVEEFPVPLDGPFTSAQLKIARDWLHDHPNLNPRS